MREEILNKICSFLNLDTNIYKENEEELLRLDYLESGLIDSFGLIQLFLYIEEEFGVSLKSEDIEDLNLRTIGGLLEKILSKVQR